MTEETIVAVYDTADRAEAAVRDLRAANVPASAISQQAEAAQPAAAGGHAGQPGFWAGLFGGEPDHDTAIYDHSLAAGSIVVAVKVPSASISTVTSILERHEPVDLDDRATSHGLAATSDASLQLVEERLSVGKRVVNRGGTRIRRFVVETPVEQHVTLHDEAVVVDRRPVADGIPVSDADFTDKTIEMTESREEVVVSKNAYVTEEVRLRKDIKDHVETVRDTVRREDIEVEQIQGDAGRPQGTTI